MKYNIVTPFSAAAKRLFLLEKNALKPKLGLALLAEWQLEILRMPLPL